jgi:hypothetical protein
MIEFLHARGKLPETNKDTSILSRKSNMLGLIKSTTSGPKFPHDDAIFNKIKDLDLNEVRAVSRAAGTLLEILLSTKTL